VASIEDHSFLLLRRLSDCFREGRFEIDVAAECTQELGVRAIPFLGRQLQSDSERCRQLARELMVFLGEDCRDRVVQALLQLAELATTDAVKVNVLGCLADLGVTHTAVLFANPADVQRRSAAQLAHLVETRADAASVADLLVSQLEGGELVDVVETMAHAVPEKARHVIEELAARIDLDASVRSELRRVTAPLTLGQTPNSTSAHVGRPAVMGVLGHPDGRYVVAVSRRVGRGLRWRNFAVLIDVHGLVVECLYEDDSTPRALSSSVIHALLEQGYYYCESPVADARSQVAQAVRRTVDSGRRLPSAYYLGRDLLALGDIHLSPQTRHGELATLHGRAVDLLASGHSDKARPLLEHCARLCPDDAEVCSSLGLCLLAEGEVALAQVWLERACLLDGGWPLHHWNLAAAAHRAQALALCYQALKRFIAATANRQRFDGDHHRRLAIAEQFTSDFERRAALAGEPLPSLEAQPEVRRIRRARSTTRVRRATTESPAPEATR
jgi:hypothetical protein